MLKINKNEIKEIDVNDVNKFIDSDDVNLNRFDWNFKDVYKGKGIYEIEIGSRGEINDIVLNDKFILLEIYIANIIIAPYTTLSCLGTFVTY